jgi:hypothetical protein
MIFVDGGPEKGKRRPKLEDCRISALLACRVFAIKQFKEACSEYDNIY